MNLQTKIRAAKATYKREWYAKNIEKQRAYKKEYRAEHKEEQKLIAERYWTKKVTE